MVMKETRPTPIISAEALAAVRFGFRMAFCRASCPVTPRSQGSGAPTARLSGSEIVRPSTDTPKNTRSAPAPTIAIWLAIWVKSPVNRAAIPSARIAAPTMIRSFEPYPVLPAATSCMAATGGTFAALRAGETAATTVTASPARPATTTVRALNTMPPPGTPTPSPLSSALRAAATPIPAPRPTSDAATPTTTASTRTEPSTWRLLAPSALSKPFSLVRCATVIENAAKPERAYVAAITAK